MEPKITPNENEPEKVSAASTDHGSHADIRKLLLERITPDNVQPTYDWGSDVGGEIIWTDLHQRGLSTSN